MLVTERRAGCACSPAASWSRVRSSVPKVSLRAKQAARHLPTSGLRAERVLYLLIDGDNRHSTTSVVARRLGDGSLKRNEDFCRGARRPRADSISARRHRVRPRGNVRSTGDRFQMMRARISAILAANRAAERRRQVPADNPLSDVRAARPEIFSWVTAIRRDCRSIPPPAGSGRSSMGPRAATSSTSESGANYGCQSSPTAPTTTAASSPASAATAWRCATHLVPSISPCGLPSIRATSSGLEGSLFTGALSNYALFRIEVDGERNVSEERLLVDRLPYSRHTPGADGCSISSPIPTMAACSAWSR